jgi:hypothetical protein
MVRRFFYLLNISLAVSSVFAVNSIAIAQTTDPYVNYLLDQANQAASDGWAFVNEIEAQLQQQETQLGYGCYTLGDSQACAELEAFYQRRIQGYDAGIQYNQDLQDSGWADSFGY